MYQALYRKWRPRSFDDVIGQPHITETLKRQIANERLSHAYLFVGTRGTGKTTCAKILARAANCEHPVNGNPCNQCSSCVGIENGAILDVEELDAASNNGVENIRSIREEAVFTPASVKKRVYIVDEVHMLSTAAFNALLKILEEPPEHLIFILATTEIQKVPATILSRCQRFSFKRITAQEIAGRLLYVSKREGINLHNDAAGILARLADGSMRDALSLLDQCAGLGEIDRAQVLSAIGLAGEEEIANLLQSILSGDIQAALNRIDSLYMSGKEISAVLEELRSLLRDILITKVAPTGSVGLLSGNFGIDVIERFLNKTSVQRLLSSIRTLQQALADMGKSADRRITAEMCMLQLCDETLSSDMVAICSRVTKLEELVASGGEAAVKFIPQVESVAREEPAVVKQDKTDERLDALAENVSSEEHKSEPSLKEVKQESSIWDEAGKDTPDFAGELTKAEVMQNPENEKSVWDTILRAVSPKVEMGNYSFLRMTSAQLRENTLSILAKDAFVQQMIDIPAVTTPIKYAAEKILGKPVVVKVVQTAEAQQTVSNQNKEDRLDSLKKFDGIIKFEE